MNVATASGSQQKGTYHQIDFKSHYCKLPGMSKDMMVLGTLNPELPTCSNLKGCMLKCGIFSLLEFKFSGAVVFSPETEAL